MWQNCGAACLVSRTRQCQQGQDSYIITEGLKVDQSPPRALSLPHMILLSGILLCNAVISELHRACAPSFPESEERSEKQYLDKFNTYFNINCIPSSLLVHL